MKKKHLLLAVAAGAMVIGMSSARAADIEPAMEPAGWYVSLFGGVSFLDNVETNYDYIGENDGNEADTDTGFIVGGAVGTHITDDIRVELEVAYSENDVNSIRFTDDDQDANYDGEGSFDILTFMANLWYDVPLSDSINPYIGGGVGLAIVDGETTYSPDNTAYDSTEVAFAFQVGAGLRLDVSDNITLDVGYRLRGIDGPSFGNSVFPNSGDYEADLMISHNVIAGVSFGL